MKKASRSASILELGLIAGALAACDPPPAVHPLAEASAETPRPRTEAGHPVPSLALPGASAAPVVPDDRCPDTTNYDRRPDAPCIAADGKVIWTPALTFDLDKSSPSPDALAIVHAVAALLERHPTIRLDVQGHTNEDNSMYRARRLDADRADAVKKALIERGVDPARVSSHGYGNSVPLYPPASEEGKRYNRRIVFVVLSGVNAAPEEPSAAR